VESSGQPSQSKEDMHEALQSKVAQAAAQATCWRQRLIASLNAWDALFCTAYPMNKHYARIRRLCKLFEELWPKQSGYEADALAEAYDKQAAYIEDVVEKKYILKISKKANLLSDQELLRFLDDLVEASAELDITLRNEVVELKTLANDDLREGIQNWLRKLQQLYWVPLEGHARVVFKEAFIAKCHGGLHLRVESWLATSSMDFIVETPLKALAVGDDAAGTPLAAAATLYRLFECSTSRSVEVSDLWKNFCACMPTNDEKAEKAEKAALKQRFGHGLLALHFMGLIAPQAGGKADSGTSFSNWRLRKRHFGRVWLKGNSASESSDAMSSLTASAPMTAADLQQIVLYADDPEHKEKKPIPNWALHWLPAGLRKDAPVPSLLKRSAPLRPTGYDPAAKRAKGVDKSRPRIFMS